MAIKGKVKLGPGFRKTFNKGVKRIMEMDAEFNNPQKNPVYYIMYRFCEISLMNAVANYDDSSNGHNLTGNTRFSFCGGIYYRGILQKTLRVLDYVDGRYTFRQAQPGDSGFVDYDTGEWIGSEGDRAVREYRDQSKRFVPVGENGYSYFQTLQFLKNFVPSRVSGYCVVIASVSPYVEYIHQWLDLDILDTNYQNVDIDLADAIKTYKSGK